MPEINFEVSFANFSNNGQIRPSPVSSKNAEKMEQLGFFYSWLFILGRFSYLPRLRKLYSWNHTFSVCLQRIAETFEPVLLLTPNVRYCFKIVVNEVEYRIGRSQMLRQIIMLDS